MSIEDLPVVGADSVFEDDHARKVREARELILAEEGLTPEGTPLQIVHDEAAERIAAQEEAARAELAAVKPTTPDPAVILAEQAEAARVRKLGPEPNPEITQEALENNPSNYKPPEEATPMPRAAAKPADGDTRQRWLCINDMGIRSGHPVFRSDAHVLGNMVVCPECGGMCVRKVMDGEVIAEDPVVVGG